jgi:stearoyl-CoA desaturase (delta-9 desaturase)
LLLINPWLAYFVWFLPVALTSVVWNSFIYYGHTTKFGYTNFETRDTSTNSWLFSILLWGEGWHNNHHNKASSYTTQEKWWEIDVIGYLITLVKK